jgi:hypothetical protein
MPTTGYEDIGTKQRGESSNAAPQGVPYWGEYPDAYDVVIIAGRPLPGLCSIKGKGYEMRAKHVKAQGKHGESTTYLANEPAEWVVHISMNTEQHLRDFEALVPLFKPPAKPKPKPAKPTTPPDAFTFAFAGLAPTVAASVQADFAPVAPTPQKDNSQPGYVAISHPLLALYRISHCRIVQATIPAQKEDKGIWEVELHCREVVLEGVRAAKTGKTGDAGIIAPRVTAFDAVLNKNNAPSQTNAGPPP